MPNSIIIVNPANLTWYSGCAITTCNGDDANSQDKILHQDLYFAKLSVSNAPTEENARVCSLFCSSSWQIK